MARGSVMFFGEKKKKKRILIVDDEMPNRMLVREVVASEDHELLEADNGQMAADMANKQNFDLVIMDVNMPQMSGIDAARAMRANPKNKNLQILMCTSMDKLGDVEKSLAAGATDYITKPVDIVRLKAKVTKLLEAVPKE